MAEHTKKHQKKPVWLDPTKCRIGKEPSSYSTAQRAARAYKYLNLWAQHEMWFDYAGPPQGSENPDWDDDDGTFYVILWSPPKKDAAPATRNLGGGLLPWNFHHHEPDGAASQGTITWQHNGGAEETLWTSDGHKNPYYCNDADCRTFWGAAGASMGSGDPAASDTIADPVGETIELFRYKDGAAYDFMTWTPDAGGGWEYGVLTTKNMMVCSLGIWPMPDPELFDDEIQIDEIDLSPDRIIKGYTGGGDTSYGELVHLVGDGTSIETEDTIEAVTRRCLLQWGHPHGVYADSSTSYSITGNTDADSHGHWKIQSRNLAEASSGVVNSYPAVFVTTTGAGGGDPATVIIKSATDTWTLEITENTTALYTYSDGSGTLDINANGTDEISVWINGPASGTIILHTVSLWEDSAQ